jgi:hypothetical protein
MVPSSHSVMAGKDKVRPKGPTPPPLPLPLPPPDIIDAFVLIGYYHK